jgi:hypothetical protein
MLAELKDHAPHLHRRTTMKLTPISLVSTVAAVTLLAVGISMTADLGDSAEAAAGITLAADDDGTADRGSGDRPPTNTVQRDDDSGLDDGTASQGSEDALIPAGEHRSRTRTRDRGGDDGTGDHGTDDHGTDDHGTDDHGTDDHGTDDHGGDDHGGDRRSRDDDGSQRPSDDDGTADRGSGDAPGTTSSSSSEVTEDRPPRTEVREDTDRRETRSEVVQAGSETYAVAAAGNVTVRRDGNTLTVAGVSPSSGWGERVERASGTEVEVTFRRDGLRIDFKAEIEGDRVEVRVREREG